MVMTYSHHNVNVVMILTINVYTFCIQACNLDVYTFCIQACNLDVQWDIECLPIVMPKLRWLAMLRDRFPPQLNLVSDFEVSKTTRMYDSKLSMICF